MGAALATTTLTKTRTTRSSRRPGAEGGPAALRPLPSAEDGVVTEPSLRDTDESSADLALDGSLVAAVGEMIRAQRADAASSLAERLAERGVDATVCAFVEDDLREAAEAMADAEAYFQETLDALGAARPSPRVLMERAADAGVLERVDHLHQVLSNMRRRLVQVAAGIRHTDRRGRAASRA